MIIDLLINLVIGVAWFTPALVAIYVIENIVPRVRKHRRG